MAFQKGQGGRPKGAKNRSTQAMREAWLATFRSLKYGGKKGGTAALTAWAQDNPTEFYKLAARLIPQEVTGADGGDIVVRVVFDEVPQ